MTIAEFIEKHGLAMTTTPAASNPNTTDDEWHRDASHWLCTLSREGARPMAVPFSMGAAHRRWGKLAPGWCRKLPPARGCGERETVDVQNARKCYTEPVPPELADVLDCLSCDSSSYDNARDFEDWAAEYGYDTDSRKAERTYRARADQAKALRHFLGAAAYDELLECERL